MIGKAVVWTLLTIFFIIPFLIFLIVLIVGLATPQKTTEAKSDPPVTELRSDTPVNYITKYGAIENPSKTSIITIRDGKLTNTTMGRVVRQVPANDASRLIMTSNGNLVIEDSKGAPVWQALRPEQLPGELNGPFVFRHNATGLPVITDKVGRVVWGLM